MTTILLSIEEKDNSLMEITLELSILELFLLEFAIKDEVLRYTSYINEIDQEIDTQMKLEASKSIDLKIYNALKDTDQLEKYKEDSKNQVWLDEIKNMPIKTFSVHVTHEKDGLMYIQAKTEDEARCIAQESIDLKGFDNSDIKEFSEMDTTIIVNILEEDGLHRSIPK